ncbi:MAG: ABC transporter ATP-binding protein [Pseudomonadales bacterium]|nr:ABC transporter ATP-binding protein [Pseudomonadales bacterium]
MNVQASVTQAGAREVVLSAEDLHTWFELKRWGMLRIGHVRAVDGVDFALERGETVAFVGESGCGKSSLARTLLGLHKPTRGRVIFEGQDLGALDAAGWRAHRARVGYVQQDPYGALAPFMDVRRILAEPLIVNGVNDAAERDRRIRAALEEVRLLPVEEFLGKFPHMLSGGQQQRVVIARALILAPTLVIADEPVSMLDASVRVEILRLLRDLQRARNLTLAFITHDLSTVRYFAERIFVMYAGRIIEQASVDALLDTPLHPYTRALLAAIPDPDPDNATHYKEIPGGEPPSLLSPPPGCRFHPRCPVAIAGRCEREDPPETTLADGHRVACWLHVGGEGA